MQIGVAADQRGADGGRTQRGALTMNRYLLAAISFVAGIAAGLLGLYVYFVILITSISFKAP